MTRRERSAIALSSVALAPTKLGRGYLGIGVGSLRSTSVVGLLLRRFELLLQFLESRSHRVEFSAEGVRLGMAFRDLRLMLGKSRLFRSGCLGGGHRLSRSDR